MCKKMCVLVLISLLKLIRIKHRLDFVKIIKNFKTSRIKKKNGVFLKN